METLKENLLSSVSTQPGLILIDIPVHPHRANHSHYNSGFNITAQEHEEGDAPYFNVDLLAKLLTTSLEERGFTLVRDTRDYGIGHIIYFDEGYTALVTITCSDISIYVNLINYDL